MKIKRKRKIISSRGITLVSLVVTIIVLMILATVSISGIFGENGFLKKAQENKKLNENKILSEEEEMNMIMLEYANVMATEPSGPKAYEDGVLPTTPKLANGMTPVKYNSTTKKWEKADITEEWYDYANKEWANVVLGDSTFVTENGVEVLDESKAYTQLVWIPRYAYKITSMYHTASSSAGDIQVAFIDTYNRDINGYEYTRDSAAEYPTATAGNNTGMSDFVVHPAFDYGGTKLEGFWVGKFESSHTNCTTDVATGQATYTGTEVMTVRANVTSWRNISVGNAFATCLAMNGVNNPYGLSTDDSIVDPHLTKNSEWGAVAYLTQSTYGKNTEVWINNSSTYITGNAGDSSGASEASGVTNAYNTGNGPQASTTGNVYGIYDMNGGAWEYIAAYVNNGHTNLITYGGGLVESATVSKYRDVYASTVKDGSSAADVDYELAIPVNGFYGDAVYEVSSSGTNETSWYNDSSWLPVVQAPFFVRGGGYYNKNVCGAFYFSNHHGNYDTLRSFRVVVPVLKEETPEPEGKPLVTTITYANHTGIEAEDALGNPVYMPGGFKVAEDTGSTVKEGIVIKDTSGNQFVWIPVSNINGDGSNKIKVDANTEVEITLGRYTFDTSTGAETIVQKGSEYAGIVTIASTYQELSTFRESNQVNGLTGTNATAKDLAGFVNSVNKNKGYYLARYEASYASGTTFGVGDNSTYYKPASKVSTSKSTSSMSYTAGTLWNFITQGNASKACRQMYYGNSYVESDLVNSYAWDTAIVYIQAMGSSNYANQTDGNGTLKNTGSTGDEKCKIFDMASNCREYLTEYATAYDDVSAYHCIISGGYYVDSIYFTRRRSRLACW